VLGSGLRKLSQGTGLSLCAALLLLGELGITDGLLLCLDLAQLLLLLGQAAIDSCIGTVAALPASLKKYAEIVENIITI